MDHRHKTYKDLVARTPTTEELLSDTIDGETFLYKTVPQCKVCSSPDEIRNLVDSLLLFPKSYKETLRLIEPVMERYELTDKERITYASIRVHQQRHLPFDKLAVREIVERRAREKNLQVLDAKENLLTSAAVYETIATKGFEDIVKGTVKPTVKETMYAMNMLDELERQGASQYRPEILLSQLNAILTAMREVLPPEMRELVLAKIEEYKNVAELNAPQDPDDFLDAEIVDEEDF